MATLILGGVLNCNGLASIREGQFDACLQDAGDPACVSSGSATASSSGSGSATTGGAGGVRATCGNGVLDPGEECDDKSAMRNTCSQCKVDCVEAGSFKDDATHHCYWTLPEEMSFFNASVFCQVSSAGRLATVTSASELSVIASHAVGQVWIGASALAPTGELAWLDGEPWDYVPAPIDAPGTGSKELCLMLTGAPPLFAMSDCALARASLCERGP